MIAVRWESGLDFGNNFHMEDGSLLVVTAKKTEAERLAASASAGDVVFYLARDIDAALALLKPAGGEVPVGIVEKASGLIASSLRKRGLRYDSIEEKHFRLCFGIFPADPLITMSACPVDPVYYARRSLNPAKKKKAVKQMVDEIIGHIGKAEKSEALRLVEEIKLLPPDYRRRAVAGIVKKFSGRVKQIEKDAKFSIPLLLSWHKSLAAVIEKLQPDDAGKLSVTVPGKAIVASVEEDYSGMKEVIADLLLAAGYAVSDAGANASAEEIAGKVKKEKPAVLILCGAMPEAFTAGADPMYQLKTCRASVRRLMQLLDEQNLRAGLDVMLAGLAFNRKFAREVSADFVYRGLNSLLAGLFERSPGKEE